MQDLDLIIEGGFTKRIINIDLSSKAELLTTLRALFALFRCKAELDQLNSGLCTLGIGESMNKYPEMFAHLFTSNSSSQLTAGECNV
jgi:hypothetical protein